MINLSRHNLILPLVNLNERNELSGEMETNWIDGGCVTGLKEYTELKEYITGRMHLLVGAWVVDRNNYDTPLGAALGWEVQQTRYWDVVSNQGHLVEVKKTNNGSIIVKLPQLAEILTQANRDASRKTLTMVLKIDKKTSSIEEICMLETGSIIGFLNLTCEDAESILRVYQRFNCAIQKTIGAKDLKGMAKFTVRM